MPLLNLEKKLAKNKELFIKIKVKTCANINRINEFDVQGVLKIEVKAKPVDNKANKEIIDLLANLLKISKQNITIISGKSSKLKLVKITSK